MGLPTLRDIAAELQKPGRDPRDQLPPPLLRTDVMELSDLKPGMKLSGTVRNVVDFGAFVDIGVHQDGLVHVSQITDRYIRHPSEVLSVGDIVEVTVLSVDPAKKRISLTMREQSPSAAQGSASPRPSAREDFPRNSVLFQTNAAPVHKTQKFQPTRKGKLEFFVRRKGWFSCP